MWSEQKAYVFWRKNVAADHLLLQYFLNWQKNHIYIYIICFLAIYRITVELLVNCNTILKPSEFYSYIRVWVCSIGTFHLISINNRSILNVNVKWNFTKCAQIPTSFWWEFTFLRWVKRLRLNNSFRLLFDFISVFSYFFHGMFCLILLRTANSLWQNSCFVSLRKQNRTKWSTELPVN